MQPLERLRLRPRLELLEDRAVPAVVAPAPRLAVQTTTINDRVVAYLEARMGQRVGGGECAHVTSEALRAAGAKFIRGADHPTPGDYVWGSLVKVVTAGGASASAARCRPGDIIQYRNTRFSNGMWASHHTSVVATVDALGRPTAVYEQNFNNQRVIVKNPIDFSLMTSGYVRIYRGVPRVPVAGRTEFTLVNNLPGSGAVGMRIGGYNLGNVILGPANRWDSYQTRYLTALPGLVPRLTVGLTSLTAVNGAACERFRLAGRPSIRRIA
ncbi:MAG: hypothetical protein ACRC33_02185 [Gemmataceae bacterium]